jgi:hypothetical protein
MLSERRYKQGTMQWEKHTFGCECGQRKAPAPGWKYRGERRGGGGRRRRRRRGGGERKREGVKHLERHESHQPQK